MSMSEYENRKKQEEIKQKINELFKKRESINLLSPEYAEATREIDVLTYKLNNLKK